MYRGVGKSILATISKVMPYIFNYCLSLMENFPKQ